jgi:hypothetical protein
MRGKVREVSPTGGDGVLEVFDVEARPDAGAGPSAESPDARAAHRGAVAGLARRRAGDEATLPVAAVPGPPDMGDSGPNGDVVRDLLRRAAAMTDAERHRLEGAATWRWGMPNPMLGVTQAPVARALAIVRGRAAGRGDAIRAIDAATAALAGSGGRRSRMASAGVAGACLAVLVRDLVEPEVFETLYGPWREVMHH